MTFASCDTAMTNRQPQRSTKRHIDKGCYGPNLVAMTIARRLLIRADQPCDYHVYSRCVRRAMLCGGDAEHRRQWVEEGLRTQAQAFAIDVLTFAVMSNHLHIVIRTDPRRVDTWSPHEVVKRWALLFPRIDPVSEEPGPWAEEEVERHAQDAYWVAVRRQRLASVSWFMRILKQRIARRANAEDGVTGHFWEGRFQSIALLDKAAVISCMAYVDLNPIRAMVATRPEDSDHTGIQRRVQARQEHRRAQAIVEADPGSVDSRDHKVAQVRARQGDEHGIWIAPCLQATAGRCTLDHYLTLVDQTGRLLRDGKPGRIPKNLMPILERLDVEVDNWVATMQSPGGFRGTAVGALGALLSEATRRGVKWIVQTTRIHRDRRRARTESVSTA